MCPFCKGGASNETTFWMMRENTSVLYKCYRAKCGAGGKINVRSGTANQRKIELGGKRRVLETSPKELGEEEYEYITRRYYLSDEEVKRSELGITNLHTHKTPTRLYIPMFRRDRTIRGYTARDLSGLEDKKAITFKWRDDEPNLSWHNCRSSKALIIVEDQFSAIRASTYMNAVALMGVTLNKAKVDEIIRAGFTWAFIALDKDATRASIKTALEWRSYLKLRVLKLEEDLKDLSREELEKFMKELDGS